MIQLGQYPAPTLTIAHFSDPHLLAEGDLYGSVDTVANLTRALDRIGRLAPRPDAIVFTGDLADVGDEAAYERLREVVEPHAREWGAEIIWVMGNHDERGPFARALFGESVDDDHPAPQDRVYVVDGLRIIALDTSVPGYHHGELSEDQLAWLGDELATPAPRGTVLAMHHPPLPLPMLRAAELIELYDQDRLAQVVAGTDVRQILAGHLHFSTYSTLGTIPVSVASATCYTCDPAPDQMFVAGVDGAQAVTMVHVYDDRLVHTIVPIADDRRLTGHPIGVAEAIEALSPEERRELLSSKTSTLDTDGVV